METSKKFRVITQCRSCGFRNLIPILSLGELYVSNFLVEKEDNKAVRAPLELVLCNAVDGGCGLLQLKHTVPSEAMFRTYWYRSGINKSMTDELTDIVKKLESIVPLSSGDFVIDIGSNDGTLLRAYDKSKEIKLVGFEPAQNLEEMGKEGVDKLFVDFFNYSAWNKEFGDAKAKIITAIAMFYDLDDPNTFVDDIVKCLDDDGVFVIQMMYLPLFIKRNAFDGICHEHLEYYSLSSLEKLLNRHGLEVCDIEMREHINEGSIRVYARKAGKGKSLSFKPGAEERVKKVRAEEESLQLNGREVYEKLAERILDAKEKSVSFIKQEVAKGKKVHGYAASTKGNTTLQFYGLTPDLIEAIADRNPVKWGKFTVGTMIPIISEEDSRAQKPDYYFVLAWHFLPEFIKRESEFLKRGGKFIVPMPEFQIVDSSALNSNENSDLPSEVTIFESDNSFEHVDERRVIHGAVGNFTFPFSLRQIKTIEFSQQSIEKKLIVGNHGHKKDSEQWEIILILGSDKEDYFLFRYRNKPSGEVKERKLKGGDFILVPPGSTFAFMAIRNGARLIEVSNKEYDATNYLTDSLF